MPGFDSVAEYYELLSDSDARLKRESAFLQSCLKQASGTRVVDTACGTGLHARHFADLGATVAAFDLSPDMIALAQQRRPHPAITYAVGDMRALTGGPWDLAICLGNSLSLLNSLDDVGNAFSAAAAVLAPGGLYAIQILNYAAAAAQQPRHRVERRTQADMELVAVKSLVPHNKFTLLSVTFHRIRNGVHTSATDTTALLNLTREEILAAAENAGLHLDALYGNFNCSEYDPLNSNDLIGVFVKARLS